MIPFLEITYNFIVPIIVIVSLAALIGRRLRPDPRAISQLVVYLFAPFLVLDGLSRSQLQANEMGLISLTVVLFCLLMASVGWILSRVCRFDRQLKSAFLISIILMNSGNYGLPLAEFAFGRDGLQRAIVFYVTMTVVTNTLGVFLASRGRTSIKRALYNVLTVPLFYAALGGLLINLKMVTVPLPLQRIISLLGQAAVPCMLVVLGLQLSHLSLNGRWGAVSLASLTRLVVAPLIAIPLATLVGLSGVAWQIVILQASMPTAVMSGVLATEFGSRGDFATAVVTVTTLASIVSLTVLLYWII